MATKRITPKECLNIIASVYVDGYVKWTLLKVKILMSTTRHIDTFLFLKKTKSDRHR